VAADNDTPYEYSHRYNAVDRFTCEYLHNTLRSAHGNGCAEENNRMDETKRNETKQS
jgi:hypothetical protein